MGYSTKRLEEGLKTMKIAIISDIHGNLLALQAVLADMRSRASTRPSTLAIS